MTKPTLMFGIGATKAGTSWLYRYLSSHPDCAMPMLKELHYFDALDNNEMGRQIERKIRQRDMFQSRIAKADPDQAELLKRRVAATDRWIEVLQLGREDSHAYLDYLYEDAGQAKLVGDITPSYALLARSRLEMMASLTPAIRFVYILRDPVDRLWSNIRMVAARTAQNANKMGKIANRLFDQVIGGGQIGLAQRSDYAGALHRLDAAVPAENRLVLFFEDLFTVDSIRSLCAFLAIPYHPAETSKRVHVGAAIQLDENRRAQAREFLAPQYAAVAGRFDALPARWQDNLVKV